jgi:23S rRNA pseudouridine1911/1915/1917 synthase
MSDSIYNFSLEVSGENLQNHKRLDHLILAEFPSLNRSLIKKLFQQGKIASSHPLELKKTPPVGTQINIQVPKPPPKTPLGEKLHLDIIFEDEFFLVVNKKAGMVTHPGVGNTSGTLVNALLHHCPQASKIWDHERPGIVHRLDKGTSGLILLVKTQMAQEKFSELFSKRMIEKYYTALVLGTKMNALGTLSSTIGRHPINRLKMAVNISSGKPALTSYHVLKKFNKISYLKMKLETGRTHQIRVHLAALLKSPILNDSLYGNRFTHLIKPQGPLFTTLKDYQHPFLHAQSLRFIHPFTKQEMNFKVQEPKIFLDILKMAENGSL